MKSDTRPEWLKWEDRTISTLSMAFGVVLGAVFGWSMLIGGVVWTVYCGYRYWRAQ